jgi:hypothetical protein
MTADSISYRTHPSAKRSIRQLRESRGSARDVRASCSPATLSVGVGDMWNRLSSRHQTGGEQNAANLIGPHFARIFVCIF